VSGLVLVFYLFAHIWVISRSRQGATAFDALFRTFEKPLFVVLDLALTGTVLYHALNGVRVLLFDFGVGIESHKQLYYVLMTLAAVLLVVFAVVSFAFIFGGGGEGAA
jgi:succinate dehydrogenase / fumarate reductase cytochrome b subunit